MLVPNKIVKLPYYERHDEINELSVPCAMLSIRNTSDVDIIGIIANLDLYSQDHGEYSANEGWWLEDFEDRRVYSFDLCKGHTRHLVIVGQFNGECHTIQKVWSRAYGRFMPSDESVHLLTGRWEVSIELIGNGSFRKNYYLAGLVHPGGNSRWSEPYTTRPAGWRSE